MCFSSRGLPSLWVQEWVRDFPSLLQWTSVSILHRLPKEHCFAVSGCTVGISPSTVGLAREGAHSPLYPKWAVLWWVKYSHYRLLWLPKGFSG